MIRIQWENALNSERDVALIRNLCQGFRTLDGLRQVLTDHLNPNLYDVYQGDNHIAIQPKGNRDRNARHVVLTDGIEI